MVSFSICTVLIVSHQRTVRLPQLENPWWMTVSMVTELPKSTLVSRLKEIMEGKTWCQLHYWPLESPNGSFCSALLRVQWRIKWSPKSFAEVSFLEGGGVKTNFIAGRDSPKWNWSEGMKDNACFSNGPKQKGIQGTDFWTQSRDSP